MTFGHKLHSFFGSESLYLVFRDRLGLKRPNPRSFSLDVNAALINVIFVENPGLLLTRPVKSVGYVLEGLFF